MIGEFMAWLGFANGAKEILDKPEKLLKTAYFFKENQSSAVIDHYTRLYGPEEKKYFTENIMKLYPLSQNLVFAFLDHYADEKRKDYEIMEAFHTVDRAFDGKREAVSRAIRASAESSSKFLEKMEKSIEAFDKNLEDIKKDRDLLEQKGSEQKELAKEVEKIKAEFEQLQISYSKEALEAQKMEIEQKRRVLEDNKEIFSKDKKELKKIQKEIKQVNTGDEKYKKAIEAIEELVKILPEGEG